MTIFRCLYINVFISLVLLSCKDEEFTCSTNTLINNDGKEGCAVAELITYSSIEKGDNEFIVLEYTSNTIGRMKITLYSGTNEILKTGDDSRWHDGVIFEISTGGEELLSGTALITNIDRNKGTVSFTFQVEIKRVNNNIYTISGSINELAFQ
jgi:hypothetical protein